MRHLFWRYRQNLRRISVSLKDILHHKRRHLYDLKYYPSLQVSLFRADTIYRNSDIEFEFEKLLLFSYNLLYFKGSVKIIKKEVSSAVFPVRLNLIRMSKFHTIFKNITPSLQKRVFFDLIWGVICYNTWYCRIIKKVESGIVFAKNEWVSRPYFVHKYGYGF